MTKNILESFSEQIELRGTGLLPASSRRVQRRHGLRITNVRPETFDFDRLNSFIRPDHRADRIGQFVLASRRFLEAIDVGKDRVFEPVKAGIIPVRPGRPGRLLLIN